ncbi:hypothetical protein ACE1AT_03435 [Pelatocladus sp. BLCC-F211]|uniref:hypothetical protein n=1 Tax=Pelatocladus sp. BLCC-F211 TaxID=3342752 RepID=UPI0035BAB60A
MNQIISNNHFLQKKFLETILQQLPFKGGIASCLFRLRYNPNNHNLTLTEIAQRIIKDEKQVFEESGINPIAARVTKKITETFKQEMQRDGIDVLENPDYQLTYQWLWEKKFPRMAWELSRNIALYALEELKMIDIETRRETRRLDLDGEIPPDNHDIKLGQRYRLQINFPYIGKSILLINEDGEGNKFLICPSKAFAEVPYTLLSEGLHFPPDDQKPGRAKSLKFLTEGSEYFLALVTEKPIELSWVNWESPAKDIKLNRERLEEIFIQVGQQSGSQVFYKKFKVVK